MASEFALALVLLIGAGLMIRTLIALQRIDPGFDPRNVVSMIVSTAGTPAADTAHHAAFYVRRAHARSRLPGIESASYINHRPFDGDMWGFAFRLEGAPHPRPGDWPTATFRVVFPGYFATMRIPILRGRDVAETDRLDTPGVVVINEFMAKTHWPGLDPIGRRITLDDSTWLTVVGIVKDNVRESLSAPHEEEMFLRVRATAWVCEGTRRLSNDDACRAGRVPARRVRRERFRGADTRRHSIRRAQRADFGGGHVQRRSLELPPRSRASICCCLPRSPASPSSSRRSGFTA